MFVIRLHLLFEIIFFVRFFFKGISLKVVLREVRWQLFSLKCYFSEFYIITICVTEKFKYVTNDNKISKLKKMSFSRKCKSLERNLFTSDNTLLSSQPVDHKTSYTQEKTN